MDPVLDIILAAKTQQKVHIPGLALACEPTPWFTCQGGPWDVNFVSFSGGPRGSLLGRSWEGLGGS